MKKLAVVFVYVIALFSSLAHAENPFPNTPVGTNPTNPGTPAPQNDCAAGLPINQPAVPVEYQIPDGKKIVEQSYSLFNNEVVHTTKETTLTDRGKAETFEISYPGQGYKCSRDKTLKVEITEKRMPRFNNCVWGNSTTRVVNHNVTKFFRTYSSPVSAPQVRSLTYMQDETVDYAPGYGMGWVRTVKSIRTDYGSFTQFYGTGASEFAIWGSYPAQHCEWNKTTANKKVTHIVTEASCEPTAPDRGRNALKIVKTFVGNMVDDAQCRKLVEGLKN